MIDFYIMQVYTHSTLCNIHRVQRDKPNYVFGTTDQLIPSTVIRNICQVVCLRPILGSGH